MNKIPRLELVASAAERKILHLDGLRSHGPAADRPAGRLWPRQTGWRELMRRIDKDRLRRGLKPVA